MTSGKEVSKIFVYTTATNTKDEIKSRTIWENKKSSGEAGFLWAGMSRISRSQIKSH